MFDIDSTRPKLRICKPQDVSRAGDTRAKQKRPETRTETILRNVPLMGAWHATPVVAGGIELSGPVIEQLRTKVGETALPVIAGDMVT